MGEALRKLSKSPPRTGFLSKGKLDYVNINLTCFAVPLTAEKVLGNSRVLPVEHPCSYIKWVNLIILHRLAHVHGTGHRLCPLRNSTYLGPSAASLVAQMVKTLPTMWETWVWSLGSEDPLEKGMANHCGVLAWRIPGTGEPREL